MPTAKLAAVTTVMLALAFPVAAPAQEELIPPGNSAVNQYTESLPTPGGARDTESGGKTKRPSPNKTLGTGNTRRLEQHGTDGRAAAEAAAETAPATSVATPPSSEAEAAPPPASGNGTGGGGGTAAGQPNGGNAAEQAPSAKVIQASVDIEEPSGSSGFGEALGEATGVSSEGQMGWLLPLAIVAIALWALAYATRQRRRVS